MRNDRRDRVGSDRADLEMARWVEADLRRVGQQRDASQQAVADAEARETRCLEALMPISAQVAERFSQVERSTRQIRSSRHHEVVVRLRQPSHHCVCVSLRWGAKFGLTDAERHLMRSYQRRPRRLWRYPDVVVGHEYHELSAVLDGATRILRLGPNAAYAIDDFLACPSVLDSYLHAGLAHPPLVASYHRRADGYQERAR